MFRSWLTNKYLYKGVCIDLTNITKNAESAHTHISTQRNRPHFPSIVCIILSWLSADAAAAIAVFVVAVFDGSL